jgi:hypothetical protein
MVPAASLPAANPAAHVMTLAASSSSTATWVAAGAAVLAAITTIVLATVAVLQMRSSDRQVDVMREHVNATHRLALAAEEEARRQQMRGLGAGSSIFSSPEQQMATALKGVAVSLARAFPAHTAAEGDDEARRDEPDGGDARSGD